MKCRAVKRSIAAYVDDAAYRGPAEQRERRDIAAHLRYCRSCAQEAEQCAQMRHALRAIPAPRIPEELAMRLRVAASRERLTRIGLAQTAWERFVTRVNNLWRPLAVPLAGGLCSTVLLFTALVPSFTPAPRTTDIPAVVFTQPTLESVSPIGFPPTDAVVDLKIDSEGRIVNWSIVEESGHKDAIHRGIENSLLFTRFAPARVAPASCSDCAVPISGIIRMVVRNSSHVEVRG